MSGRKQHFIPQSLLKGFGRAGKGTKVQVVVYTHSRGIFVAATDGIAAEREFYSELAVEGEGETLDDKITTYETSLAGTLSILRSLGNSEAADTQAASEFVSHLVVRNDHLRKFMSSAGSALFGGFAETMTDQEEAKALLGLSGEKPSAMFAEQIEKAFTEYKPLIDKLGISQEQFAEFVFGQSKTNFSELHSGIIGPLQQAFSEATGKLPETAADAHRRSLDEALSPQPRVEKMKAYEWRVVHLGSPLILPDCVAVAFDLKGDATPLMFAELDEAEEIYVPLSADRLLVGSKQGADVHEDLNEAFASCCWDFFVAKDRTEELEALREKIRSRPGKYINDTIDGVLSDSLQKAADKSDPGE